MTSRAGSWFTSLAGARSRHRQELGHRQYLQTLLSPPELAYHHIQSLPLLPEPTYLHTRLHRVIPAIPLCLHAYIATPNL